MCRLRTPAEIAEEAVSCQKAGAAIVHVHARGPDKQPTADKKVFGDIIRRIRDKCDILIQTTNGIGVHREPATGRLVWPTDEERLGLLSIEPRQECSRSPAARGISTIRKAVIPVPPAS